MSNSDCGATVDELRAVQFGTGVAASNASSIAAATCVALGHTPAAEFFLEQRDFLARGTSAPSRVIDTDNDLASVGSDLATAYCVTTGPVEEVSTCNRERIDTPPSTQHDEPI